MNRGAVDEMAAIDPEVVLVKGDLTSDGSRRRVDAFPAATSRPSATASTTCGATTSPGTTCTSARCRSRRSSVGGATLAMIDTSVDGAEYGGLTNEQLEWLDELAAGPTGRSSCSGTTTAGTPDPANGPSATSASTPDDSEQLVKMVAGRPSIAGYFAGHTHRNRVRRFAATGDVPLGRGGVREGLPGRLGRVPGPRRRRAADRAPHLDARRARRGPRRPASMYAGLYHDYAFGSLADRCFAILDGDRPMGTVGGCLTVVRDRRDAEPSAGQPVVAIARGRRRTRAWDEPGLDAWTARELVVHGDRAYRTVVEYLEGEVKDPTPWPRPPPTSASCWPSRRRTSTSPPAPSARRSRCPIRSPTPMAGPSTPRRWCGPATATRWCTPSSARSGSTSTWRPGWSSWWCTGSTSPR